ncbi:expressed unknown protein [Seminavis robusta]|uniref:Uncharacterized protein n=1 Tax=Seminavis robusta TaxID=568900 RepID=A0A9N8EFP2_9STRA|nr:expressed unknown protein [Seminavis robusta]|eukprot:Sro1118_g243110.1 n/a (180) ;mRNA; r:17843-18489
MAYNFDPHSGEAELIMDLTKWDRSEWRKPEGVADTIRGCYYICHATFPSFQTVRVGNVHIFECEGYGWKMDMLDLKMFGKISEESHGSFPSHIRQTRFFHTPSMLNIVVSMTKKLVPNELSDSFKVGCQFAGGRLNQFYMLPTPQVATERAVANLSEGLRIRYECEQRFSLDDDDDDDE